MSGAYPPALRSMLKAVPCLVMCLSASYVWWIVTYAFIKHPHDHIPRFSYKYPTFYIDRPNSNCSSGKEMTGKETLSSKCSTGIPTLKQGPIAWEEKSFDIMIQHLT